MNTSTVVRAIGMAGALGVMPALAAAQQPATAPRPATVQGAAKKQAAPTPAPRAAAVSAMPQGFNVVLVLGDLVSGPHTPDLNLPAAARKALDDMRDFLPYNNYRLLDTAWILGANETTIATSRLRGFEEREYELTLSTMAESTTPGPKGPLRISFLLREPGARDGISVTSSPSLDHLRSELAAQIERRALADREAKPGAQIADLERQQAALESELRAARERYGEWHPSILVKQRELDRLVGQIAAMRAQGANAERAEINRRMIELRTRTESLPRLEPRRIIDTGFTMEIGETVVVGSSRVGGDKAILALLTAVPRNTKK